MQFGFTPSQTAKSLTAWCWTQVLQPPVNIGLCCCVFLQRRLSWRHCDRRRVPTTQQNREVQRPQSDKGCWSQEAVPEVLGDCDQDGCCLLTCLTVK